MKFNTLQQKFTSGCSAFVRVVQSNNGWVKPCDLDYGTDHNEMNTSNMVNWIITKMKFAIFLIVGLLVLPQPVLSQSKKEQIRKLTFMIDSLNQNVSEKDMGLDSLKTIIYNLDKNSKELNNNHDKLIEYSNFLKASLNMKEDTIINLKNNLTNCLESMYSRNISFIPTMYSATQDWVIGSDSFNAPYGYKYFKTIYELKEKTRISNSKYAERRGCLFLKTLNGNEISLCSTTDPYAIMQEHYTYLFENDETKKMYYVKIELNFAGGNPDVYSLYELNLIDGAKKIISDKIGGEFYFSPRCDYVIVGGFYSVGTQTSESEVRVVDLTDRLSDFVISGIESTDIKWLSANKFQCMTIPYKVLSRNWDKGFPHKTYDLERHPRKCQYTLLENKWSLTKSTP
jgi:hypothetical protein